MVWTGSRVGVWGGNVDGDSTDTGFFYDPEARTYQLIPVTENTPQARADFDDSNTGMNRESGLWLIWGGRTEENNSQVSSPDQGAVYDQIMGAWYPVGAASPVSPAPYTRASVHVVPRGDQWVVFGGDPDGSQMMGTDSVGNRVLETHWYDGGGVRRGLEDPEDDCWWGLADTLTSTCPSTVAEFPASFATRKYGVVQWLGDRMVVWGGTYQHTAFYNDGFVYDYATKTRTVMETDGAPASRDIVVSAASPDALYVFSGLGEDFSGPGSFLDDGAVYDFGDEEWTPLPATQRPSPRLGRGFWIHDRYFFVPQGIYFDGMNLVMTDDAALFDSATGDWILFEPDNSELITRFQGNLVWAGDRLIMWGGSVISGTPPMGAELVLPGCLADPP